MASSLLSRALFADPSLSLSSQTIAEPRFLYTNRNEIHCVRGSARKAALFAPRASAVSAVENSRVPVRENRKIESPIVVIDNYDSFTYNLCQYMGEMGCDFEVYRNDDLSVEELKSPFTAGRYHSLVIEKESFPSDVLEITAWTVDGLIMAARHKKYPHLQGVQFHPESIITIEGKALVRNFIKFVEKFEERSEK
ncbi:hypothetical protein Sjap_014707 [Stephania japonica]|uniref:anthranilate synthase n=1 Tax=Stephania japonica TaxID=461633 RepID=A0AAP0II88_9MAGN